MYHESLMVKWLMHCVFPGVDEVWANLLLSHKQLMRDDFPTFERPINANSGSSVPGLLEILSLLPE